jgi:hypothetical protein
MLALSILPTHLYVSPMNHTINSNFSVKIFNQLLFVMETLCDSYDIGTELSHMPRLMSMRDLPYERYFPLSKSSITA